LASFRHSFHIKPSAERSWVPRRETDEEEEMGVLEISEYIHAFRSSSDRARYVIFVITATALLILVGSWKSTRWSETQQLEVSQTAALANDFEREQPRPSGPPPATDAEAEAQREKAKAQYIAERLRPRADEARELASKSQAVELPDLGIYVYRRDLGHVGGLILLILSFLLSMSMVRQHENLYLAIFKIMRMRERHPQDHDDGESRANFLYHALAMAQVLNYPPTLARWRYGWRNRVAGFIRWLVFLFPAGVLLFVMIEVSKRLTVASIVFLTGVTVLSVISAGYSRSCNARWRAAFRKVNPALDLVDQRPLFQWLKVFSKHQKPDPLSGFLRELMFRIRTTPPVETGSCEVVDRKFLIDGRVTHELQRRMAASLHAQATGKARGVCAPRGLEPTFTKMRAIENTITKTEWIVRMDCTFECRPIKTSGAETASEQVRQFQGSIDMHSSLDVRLHARELENSESTRRIRASFLAFARANKKRTD
jgi:hypothetical protein